MIRIIQVPYDSGHRARRMGAGPLHLAEAMLSGLRGTGSVVVVPVESEMSFPTEIGTAFELHRSISAAVFSSIGEDALPIVLSGNCNSSLGTVSGLQQATPDEPIGVIWFDGHGDCSTPETFTGDFLDAMGLSTLTGRCWQSLAATVPGFQPIPDERVVLIGAHAVDQGSRKVLAASRIEVVPAAEIRSHPVLPLRRVFDRLKEQSVRSVYLHLDVDVLDAEEAVANEFAAVGGLSSEQLAGCVGLVVKNFDVAAVGVASYDPTLDASGRVRDTALRIIADVARSRVADGAPFG